MAKKKPASANGTSKKQPSQKDLQKNREDTTKINLLALIVLTTVFLFVLVGFALKQQTSSQTLTSASSKNTSVNNNNNNNKISIENKDTILNHSPLPPPTNPITPTATTPATTPATTNTSTNSNNINNNNKKVQNNTTWDAEDEDLDKLFEVQPKDLVEKEHEEEKITMDKGGNVARLPLLFKNWKGLDSREWDVISTRKSIKEYPVGIGAQTCIPSLPFYYKLWPTPMSLYEQVQPVTTWNPRLQTLFQKLRNFSHFEEKKLDIFGALPPWKSDRKVLPLAKFTFFTTSRALLAAPRHQALPTHGNGNGQQCTGGNGEGVCGPPIVGSIAATTREEDDLLLENSISHLLRATTKVVADILTVENSDVTIRLTDGWVVMDEPGQQQSMRQNHHHLHHFPKQFDRSEVHNESLEVVTDWTVHYVVQSNGQVKRTELYLTDPRIQASVLERGIYDTYDQRFFLHSGSLIVLPASIGYSFYVNYGNRTRTVLTLLVTTKTRLPAKPLNSCYECPASRSKGPTGSALTVASESTQDSSLDPSLTSTILVNGEQIAVPSHRPRIPIDGNIYHWHRWVTGVLQYSLPEEKKQWINSCLSEYSLQMQEKDDGIYLSNYGGFHSKTNIWEKDSPAPPEYQACLNVVRDYAYHAVTQYLQYSMYPVNADTRNAGGEIAWSMDIVNAWINVNGKSHFNVPHIHPGTVVSGVYYVDHGGDECSSLYFDNPMHASVHEFAYLGQDLNHEIGKNYISDNHLAVHSVPGTYLIFPSWLQHYTLPHHCPANNTAETSVSSDSFSSDDSFRTTTSRTGCRRISIAFNVYVDKNQHGNTWCSEEELQQKWCAIYPTRHLIPRGKKAKVAIGEVENKKENSLKDSVGV